MSDNTIVHDEASEVQAVNGGDVTLTPDAAEETSERLMEASVRARGQQRLKRYPHRPVGG